MEITPLAGEWIGQAIPVASGILPLTDAEKKSERLRKQEMARLQSRRDVELGHAQDEVGSARPSRGVKGGQKVQRGGKGAPKKKK